MKIESIKAAEAELDTIASHLSGMGGSIRTGELGVICKRNLTAIRESLSFQRRYLELRETHVLVPREPDKHMMNAFLRAGVMPRDPFTKLYKAMIAATNDPLGDA